MTHPTQGEAPDVHLADLQLTYDQARDQVADAVLRFDGADRPAEMARLAGFLERFAQAVQLTASRADPENTRKALAELAGEGVMPDLTAVLVRSGQCRRRAARHALAECLVAMAELLVDDKLTDGLWGHWLDRRELSPSERLRQLWLKNAERRDSRGPAA